MELVSCTERGVRLGLLLHWEGTGQLPRRENSAETLVAVGQHRIRLTGMIRLSDEVDGLHRKVLRIRSHLK